MFLSVYNPQNMKKTNQIILNTIQEKVRGLLKEKRKSLEELKKVKT